MLYCLTIYNKLILYGLKTKYATNFPSECSQSGVCNFARIFLVNIKTYFSDLFLKIHPPGPAQVIGTLWKNFVGCTLYAQKGAIFLLFSIIPHFLCSISRLVKKPQQFSLNEVIEDILPFLWNTKRPLRNILLLRYKQNSLG